MPRQSPARTTFAAALALSICLGCAVSEPIDPENAAKNRLTGTAGTGAGSSAAGTAGADVSGLGGSSAGTGQTGIAGTLGAAGTTGAAGTGKVNVTSGQAGDGGAAGTSDVSGQAGSGAGGSAAGAGGRGGATGGTGGGLTGLAGRGGTTGSAGRGGTMGSAGRGGTTGSAGRGGSGGSVVDAGTSVDGAAAATFTEVYTTILVTYCSGSSCHKPGAAGGIDFSTQANAYDSILPRVVPGKGSSSSFYMTVNSGSMPRGQAKLSATNLSKIKSWIDAGALDN
jgi:hypothetical protein